MHCKNCSTKLSNSQNYCYECGGKVITKRLTFKSICNEINNHFFNLDNKILKTFIELFVKPRGVIVDYINGTRKKHVNVIQYFGISLTLVGIQVFLMNTIFKDALHESMNFMDSLNNMPNSDKNPFANFNMEHYNNYQSVIYVFSVPISAFSSWAACYIIGERKYNFTEHIVINLYYSSQIIILSSFLFIIFLFLSIDYLAISTIVTILTFAYFYFILHKVFKTKTIESVARFLLIMVVYAILFALVFVLFVIFGIVYVKINQ